VGPAPGWGPAQTGGGDPGGCGSVGMAKGQVLHCGVSGGMAKGQVFHCGVAGVAEGWVSCSGSRTEL
jgi:hypothetical protein